MKEVMDPKGKGLFYQNMRVALPVVIDNSEMTELKEHRSGFSPFSPFSFFLFPFFFILFFF